MQCPAFQDNRIRMFNDVESIFAKDGQMLRESGADVLSMLIGAAAPGLSPRNLVLRVNVLRVIAVTSNKHIL